jgi:hypothetical protein
MRSLPMAMMRETTERRTSRPELALRVGDHRLDDVAAEVPVLGAARDDLDAGVGAPDHLIGGGLDVVRLKRSAPFL